MLSSGLIESNHSLTPSFKPFRWDKTQSLERYSSDLMFCLLGGPEGTNKTAITKWCRFKMSILCGAIWSACVILLTAISFDFVLVVSYDLPSLAGWSQFVTELKCDF